MKTPEQKLKRKLLDKKRRDRFLSQGFCCICGKRSLHSKALCKVCIDKAKTNRSKIDKEKLLNGLCIRCSGSKQNSTVLCENCILKRTAQLRLGSSTRYKEIEELFARQNVCPYTGIKLKLGESASLDHVIPISNGGSNDIENLEWIHTWVNLMKKDLSKEEFIIKFEKFIDDCNKFAQPVTVE